ncbi:uncharacterized protein LOC132715930 isoform X2 [Ruditapes philippinarum]|uniref:uncharacterized protein LOC132715930 isoform X2 n=1 Tax=Ruditapes philippinarum TaxID=129788 RepID=UPI00295B77B0|nr:uncharacterized protein LOC132715930 isoform X2 [Ruditapes philippinarum]
MQTRLLSGFCVLLVYMAGTASQELPNRAVPVPGRGALKGYCNTNIHCNKDECCVSFVTPRGKRSLPPDLRRFVRGKCEKRGRPNSECLVRDLSLLKQEIYYHSCPCLNAGTCIGTGVFLPPLGERGICGAKKKHCSSCADCSPSECCVNIRIIGKRSADRMKRQEQGQCEPMGKQGSGCLVRNASGRPHDVVQHSCPCRKGLTCVGSGVNEIPVGEVGVCRRKGY